MLRYLREKPPAKWASLPINQDTADLIEAQQQRLRGGSRNPALEAAVAAAAQVQPDRAAGDVPRRR